ncbi:HSP20-like chaperone [Radiomyces spectabilis]|uniref:HSP20-like chaperone n=1 Tax=Radiomyces spectabilis TaxID=64574 RepID=UPI00222011D6|nr:HSP20-like chaperone [Radiomyces spectabilis]KAI8376231.1 HSP20-like chaperone [Radiomyces spectabilis]
MALSQRLFSEAFRDMQRAFSMFDEPIFNVARRSAYAPLMRYPATDIRETPEAYELHAELPGVKKQDIEIEMADEHTLVLRGKIDQHKAESSEPTTEATASATSATSETSAASATATATEGTSGANVPAKATTSTEVAHPQQQWWTNERVTGSFQRAFTLPSRIQADAIKAKYEDGVLKVTVPKRQEDIQKAVRIPVDILTEGNKEFYEEAAYHVTVAIGVGQVQEERRLCVTLCDKACLSDDTQKD